METATESRTASSGRRYLRFSLRTCALLVGISALVFARYASEIRKMWNDNHSPVKVVRTVEDLREALRGQRSAIYCDVQWSIDAVQGHQVFHEFALQWNERMPQVPVRFYLLDLTERSAVVNEAVEHWGLSETRGSGEILWISDGSPRAYTHLTGRLSNSELAVLAQRAFDLPTIATFAGEPPETPDWDLYEGANLADD